MISNEKKQFLSNALIYGMDGNTQSLEILDNMIVSGKIMNTFGLQTHKSASTRKLCCNFFLASFFFFRKDWGYWSGGRTAEQQLVDGDGV